LDRGRGSRQLGRKGGRLAHDVTKERPGRGRKEDAGRKNDAVPAPGLGEADDFPAADLDLAVREAGEAGPAEGGGGADGRGRGAAGDAAPRQPGDERGPEPAVARRDAARGAAVPGRKRDRDAEEPRAGEDGAAARRPLDELGAGGAGAGL